MTLWREIADTLVHEIDNGALAPGAQLPTDEELSRRFSVNRHTIRRALSHLASEGLVRSERGRGTFVVEGALLYRLGTRTRFEENLLENLRAPHRRLLFSAETSPPDWIAAKLGLGPGQLAILATLMGEADGVPIQVFEGYFPAHRFPSAKEVFAAIAAEPPENIVLAELFDALGVGEHRRSEARFRTRLPSAVEASQLKMAKTEPVLELRVLNVDAAGAPVYFGLTTFCGSRIEFVIDV